MDITPLIPQGRQLIQSYGDGGFRISGTRYDGSVLVFPGETQPWPVAAIGEVTAESLAAIAEASPKVEILLLGTGARMSPLAGPVRRHLRAAGIAVDVMDTGAACRTFNVLLSEERRVVAALIAVGT